MSHSNKKPSYSDILKSTQKMMNKNEQNTNLLQQGQFKGKSTYLLSSQRPQSYWTAYFNKKLVSSCFYSHKFSQQKKLLQQQLKKLNISGPMPGQQGKIYYQIIRQQLFKSIKKMRRKQFAKYKNPDQIQKFPSLYKIVKFEDFKSQNEDKTVHELELSVIAMRLIQSFSQYNLIQPDQVSPNIKKCSFSTKIIDFVLDIPPVQGQYPDFSQAINVLNLRLHKFKRRFNVQFTIFYQLQIIKQDLQIFIGLDSNSIEESVPVKSNQLEPDVYFSSSSCMQQQFVP